MNAQGSRKIIVAGTMAVVVGVAATTFVMRSPPAIAPVAQTVASSELLTAGASPVEAVAPAPDAPLTVASAPPVTPAAAAAPVAPVAAVAPVVAAPVAPKTRDVAAIKRPAPRVPEYTASQAVEPKPAAALRGAVEGPKAAAADDAASYASQSPDTSMQAGTTTAPVATDSEITTKVKSEIAADSVGGNQAVSVVTTDGVVALTGSLASQDAIDHLKMLVANVKDVKSVDTSALNVPVL